jgi:hypothetical protein
MVGRDADHALSRAVPAYANAFWREAERAAREHAS